MKVNGGYDWFRYMVTKEDGHQLTEYKEELVYPSKHPTPILAV